MRILFFITRFRYQIIVIHTKILHPCMNGSFGQLEKNTEQLITIFYDKKNEMRKRLF